MRLFVVQAERVSSKCDGIPSGLKESSEYHTIAGYGY
jgi:hypothetical protein